MGKKWRYREPELESTEKHYYENSVSYNAVEYNYPEVTSKFRHRTFETKNVAKFKELFNKNKQIVAKNAEPSEVKSGKAVVLNENVEKSESVTSGYASTESNGTNSDLQKKKKKKKKSKEEKLNLTAEETVVQDQNEMSKKLKKKSKKEKKRSKESSKPGTDYVVIDKHLQHHLEEKVEDCDTLEVITGDKIKKKKKTKQQKDEIVNEQVTKDVDSSEMLLNDSIKKKKNKKDKCKESLIQDDSADMGEKNAKIEEMSNKSVTKTKKSKKHKKCGTTEISPQENVSKKEKRKRKLEVKDEIHTSDCHQNPAKKKKKRKRDTEKTDDGNLVNERAETVTVKEKVKKKKRIIAEVDDADVEINVEPEKMKKKKKRKHDVEIVENVTPSPETCSSKKLKKSKMELKKEADDDETGSKYVMGQWQTASFDTTQQKSKFLRLMGGGKDVNGDVPVKNAQKPKFNTALDKNQEEKLNQGLEKQFNSAMNILTTKGRGSGLGFEKDPAEGKKFHIDVNQNKSIKFDD